MSPLGGVGWNSSGRRRRSGWYSAGRVEEDGQNGKNRDGRFAWEEKPGVVGKGKGCRQQFCAAGRVNVEGPCIDGGGVELRGKVEFGERDDRRRRWRWGRWRRDGPEVAAAAQGWQRRLGDGSVAVSMVRYP